MAHAKDKSAVKDEVFPRLWLGQKTQRGKAVTEVIGD
jgi:hypothetical protein